MAGAGGAVGRSGRDRRARGNRLDDWHITQRLQRLGLPGEDLDSAILALGKSLKVHQVRFAFVQVGGQRAVGLLPDHHILQGPVQSISEIGDTEHHRQ